MTIDERFLLLRNHKLFAQLTAQECGELNIINGFLNAKKNEFIYLNQLRNDRLYFLKKGYVKIGHYDEQGNEVIKEILQEGDIFGQVGLEEDGDNGEFAQALKKDAQICSFTVTDFEHIMEKRPDLAISFSKIVGLRLKRLQVRLTNILHHDVKQRLADFFLSLALREKPNEKGEVELENFLTHYDIACLIGSTRQTVTTLINDLEYQKIVTFNRKQLIIHQPEKLKKLVG